MGINYYHSTDEIKIPVKDEHKFLVIDMIKDILKQKIINFQKLMVLDLKQIIIGFN